MSRNAPQSRPGGRNHLARDEAANAFPPQQSPDRAGLAELMTTTPALDRAFSLSQSVLRTVPMWQPLRKTESSCGVTIPALASACFSHCIRSLKDIAQAMFFIQG